MARLDKTCPGDCSKCEMLANKEVQMIPCILDQIFQTVRKTEKGFTDLANQMTEISATMLELSSAIESHKSDIPPLVGGDAE